MILPALAYDTEQTSTTYLSLCRPSCTTHAHAALALGALQQSVPTVVLTKPHVFGLHHLFQVRLVFSGQSSGRPTYIIKGTSVRIFYVLSAQLTDLLVYGCFYCCGKDSNWIYLSIFVLCNHDR